MPLGYTLTEANSHHDVRAPVTLEAVRTFVLLAIAGCNFNPAGAPDDGSRGSSDGVISPTCSDGQKDGDETGVDCGGSCPACTACTDHTLPPSTNVDATQWSASFLTSPSWSCTAAGTTTIDSQAGTVVSSTCALGTLDITNDVPQLAGGPNAMVVRLTGLSVTNGHVLELRGDKPIIFLVAGDVTIDSGGTIDASAVGATPGPGGSIGAECPTGTGASASSSGWGGGGGGFGTPGGQGCYNIVNGGMVDGSDALAPLRGGCSGGTNSAGGQGGAGGGAIEISASGAIAIGATATAVVVASGGGGPASSSGGVGGGSGGAILLVASAMPTFGSGGAARVNGGAGSSGCSGCSNNDSGQDGHATDNSQATDASGMPGGGNGNDRGRVGGMAYVIGGASPVTLPGSMTTAQSGGRGGGGGGGGRIQITTGTTIPACD